MLDLLTIYIMYIINYILYKLKQKKTVSYRKVQVKVEEIVLNYKKQISIVAIILIVFVIVTTLIYKIYTNRS